MQDFCLKKNFCVILRINPFKIIFPNTNQAIYLHIWKKSSTFAPELMTSAENMKSQIATSSDEFLRSQIVTIETEDDFLRSQNATIEIPSRPWR